jgi:hypothetical protein
MSDFLPAAVGAVVSDVLSVCGVPGASTVGVAFSAAVEAVMKRRRDNAREILLEELRKGKAFVDRAASIDEWVAVLLRYSRAAQEGTARLNLRLMAKVIAGQAQAGALVADEFLRYADALGSLKREEVVLLTVLHRKLRTCARTPSQTPNIPTRFPWKEIWYQVAEELVPDFFDYEGEMRASAYAAGRTGLIYPLVGDEDDLGFFTTSTQLDKIQKLASFQDALREEGIDLEGGHGCS